MGYESTGLNMRLVIRALLTEGAHSFSDFDRQTEMELITGAGIRFGPQWNTCGLTARVRSIPEPRRFAPSETLALATVTNPLCSRACVR